jgi:hypothetical protein
MRTATDNPPTKEEYLQLAQDFEDVGYESNAAHMRERAKRLEE